MNIVKIILLLIVIFLITRGLKNRQNVVINKDFINPSDGLGKNNDFKPWNSSYKKAWTENSVNKNPRDHSSTLVSEKTSIGDFFDKNNQFIDYKRSKGSLPDRCFVENDEVICKFNNKIENPPPTLIEDKENNQVLKSIGDDSDIDTNIISSKNIVFGKSNRNVWESKNEKTINGGKYFGEVTGYSDSDGVLRIDNFKGDSRNYSF
jgi:hypothetical protein